MVQCVEAYVEEIQQLLQRVKQQFGDQMLPSVRKKRNPCRTDSSLERSEVFRQATALERTGSSGRHRAATATVRAPVPVLLSCSERFDDGGNSVCSAGRNPSPSSCDNTEVVDEMSELSIVTEMNAKQASSMFVLVRCHTHKHVCPTPRSPFS